MSRTRTSKLRRRNIITALVLVAVALAVAGSMFWYRFSHHLTPLPEGSSYGSPYLPQQ